jgi:hypothetical protein
MNILNLAKTHSLYECGMKPVVFSLKKFRAMFPNLSHNVDPLRVKEGW